MLDIAQQRVHHHGEGEGHRAERGHDPPRVPELADPDHHGRRAAAARARGRRGHHGADLRVARDGPAGGPGRSGPRHRADDGRRARGRASRCWPRTSWSTSCTPPWTRGFGLAAAADFVEHQRRSRSSPLSTRRCCARGAATLPSPSARGDRVDHAARHRRDGHARAVHHEQPAVLHRHDGGRQAARPGPPPGNGPLRARRLGAPALRRPDVAHRRASAPSTIYVTIGTILGGIAGLLGGTRRPGDHACDGHPDEHPHAAARDRVRDRDRPEPGIGGRRHRPARLARRLPPGPRPAAARCARRSSSRPRAWSGSATAGILVQPPAAEHHELARRPGHVRRRERDHPRGGAELPRPRRADPDRSAGAA